MVKKKPQDPKTEKAPGFFETLAKDRFLIISILAFAIIIVTISLAAFTTDNQNLTQNNPQGNQNLILPPSDLSIKINDGKKYVNSHEVTLYLNAVNATECRYKNDEDTEWSDWEPYVTSKKWKLSNGTSGERIVAYQCRNGEVEGGIALAKVILDVDQPIVSIYPRFMGSHVNIFINGRDLVSEVIECTIVIDEKEERRTIVRDENGQYRLVLLFERVDFSPRTILRATCYDMAGNKAKILPREEIPLIEFR